MPCSAGLSVKFKDLHVAYAALVYAEAEGCPDYMEALDAGCSRVYDQHITQRVTHYLKDVGVATDKDVRSVLLYKLPCFGIVSARIASDMGHKHLHALTFEEAVKGMGEAEIVVVTVAGDTYKGLELSDSGSKIKASAEVAGVPDLVHRGEEFTEFGAEDAVGV